LTVISPYKHLALFCTDRRVSLMQKQIM